MRFAGFYAVLSLMMTAGCTCGPYYYGPGMYGNPYGACVHQGPGGGGLVSPLRHKHQHHKETLAERRQQRELRRWYRELNQDLGHANYGSPHWRYKGRFRGRGPMGPMGPMGMPGMYGMYGMHDMYSHPMYDEWGDDYGYYEGDYGYGQHGGYYDGAMMSGHSCPDCQPHGGYTSQGMHDSYGGYPVASEMPHMPYSGQPQMVPPAYGGEVPSPYSTEPQLLYEGGLPSGPPVEPTPAPASPGSSGANASEYYAPPVSYQQPASQLHPAQKAQLQQVLFAPGTPH